MKKDISAKLAKSLVELFNIVKCSYVVAKNNNADQALARAEKALDEYKSNGGNV